MAIARTNGSPEEVKVWPVQVIGGKYVRLLEKSMQQLHGESEHGNRQLYLDDVFVAYLLAFFNPSIRSLRTIEDFSQTRQAPKHLSIRKICKSTLSDFNKLADPQRLEPILRTLRDQLSRKQHGRRLPENDLQALLRAHYQETEALQDAVAKSFFVVRYKQAGGNSPELNDVIDCPLTEADRAAGVISDRVQSGSLALLGNRVKLTSPRMGKRRRVPSNLCADAPICDL